MMRPLLLLVALLTALLPRAARMVEPQRPDWLPLKFAEVRAGDTLESLALGLGLPRDLVPALATEYGRFASQGDLQPGERLILSRHDKDGRLRLECHPGRVRRLAILLPLAQQGDSLLSLPEAGWTTSLDSLAGVRSLRVIQGRVGGTLWDGVLAAGGGPQTVLAFADIFQWDVDFLLDVREGDAFWLVQAVTRYGGQWLVDSLTEEGPILAARWQGAVDQVAAARHEGCGVTGYFDEQGRSFQKQFLKSPLNYRRISSQFGMRGHPILRRVRMHHGIDYSAPQGTPVAAAAAGTVLSARWETGYGKVIRVRHDRRHATVYGHLSRFAAGLRAGRRVEQNEVIGYVGATGLATGPHLHYEFMQDGRSVNPQQALNQPGKPVPSACLADYLATFRRWHSTDVAGAR